MGHPLKNYRTSNQPFGSLATAGVVGSYYGTEVQYLVAEYGNYQPYGHAGADYPTPVGTPVYAISAGTVLWAGWAEDLPNEGNVKKWLLYPNFPGIVTVIQHSWGISLTAHMSEAWLNVGDKVSEGQQIGLTGNTKARGQYVGAHVHIEALVDLSYRTGGGLIYGRTNPEQFYGTINYSGTITPQEDEDMPLSGDDHQFILEVIDDYFKNVRPFDGNRNIIDAMKQTRTDVLSTKAAVEAIPQKVLFDNRIDGRNLFDWSKQIRADIAGIKPGSIDIPTLAAALAEQLPKSDVAELAKQLEITVKEVQ